MAHHPAMGSRSTEVLHFLLLAATAVAANSLVELSTANLEVAPCHHRITLHCNISSDAPLTVKSLYWLSTNTSKPLCGVIDQKPLPEANGVHCVYSPGRQLKLTFRHTWAANQSTYTCKLYSNRGIKASSATVKLQDCYRSAHHHSSSSATTCNFSGVYPKAEVHWFNGDKNLTGDRLHHSIESNHDGTFNVSSSFPVNATTGAHQCSLWIHASESYMTKYQIPMTQFYQGNGATSVQAMEVSLGFLLAWLLMV